MPGTGKSTTIFHVIQSRVQQDARVLITSIRNQAIDAVTEKVDSFGVLVSVLDKAGRHCVAQSRELKKISVPISRPPLCLLLDWGVVKKEDM